MSVDLNASSWQKQHCRIKDQGIIVEDDTSGEPHGVFREAGGLIPPGTTHAVLQAIVRPKDRTRCWIGARANNRDFMASFDLARGMPLGKGAHVEAHEVIAIGDGAFECRLTFDGGFPMDQAFLAVGAMLDTDDQQEDYSGIAGKESIELIDILVAEGTSYVPFPIETPAEDANESELHVIVQAKSQLTAMGVVYSPDRFTAMSTVKWSSDDAAGSVLFQHWEEATNQRAWRLLVNEEGRPTVELSSDGASVAKCYRSKSPLIEDKEALLAFRWDGSALSLFINDLEITDENLDIVVDKAIESSLHSSTSALKALGSEAGISHKHWLWNVARSDEDIAADALALGLTGWPQNGETDSDSDQGITLSPESKFPTTLEGMKRWLVEQGVALENIRYVDNTSGKDSNDGVSTSKPWATIQHAANTLTAGMAVIIRGRGGRFFEHITPRHSGREGARIWFVGDPEYPAIIDSSEAFEATWTNRGGGMYSAPYNRRRYFNKEVAYYNSCTAGHCRPEATFMGHQLIYEDRQLVRVSTKTQHASPTSLNPGESYFKTNGSSDDDFRTPKEVWCRLPGNANPNQGRLRIASDKKYLFDFSEFTWVDGFPGGLKTERAKGRDYLGLVNLHFKFGGLLRKVGPVNVRGKGWHLEHCSFSDSNCEAASFYGDDHTILDCKFVNFGKGLKGDELQNGPGRTLFSRCLFENGNIHRFPEAWEAGFKMSDCGHGGPTIWEDCLFKNIMAARLWWDINCGGGNAARQAFIIRRSVFERCARHAVFPENNTYYVIVEQSAIWNTQYSFEGQGGQKLASGIRIAGSGLNTIRNSAIVFNEGKGIYNKVGSDGRASRLGGNQNIMTDNVILQNARNPSIEFQRVEHYGGKDCSQHEKDWSTSTIRGNVYYGDLHDSYFCEDSRTGLLKNNALNWFQEGSRTAGRDNIIARSAAEVVEDYENRKKFFVTRHAGGQFPQKGPTELVHYEDLPGTGWAIPK